MPQTLPDPPPICPFMPDFSAALRVVGIYQVKCALSVAEQWAGQSLVVQIQWPINGGSSSTTTTIPGTVDANKLELFKTISELLGQSDG